VNTKDFHRLLTATTSTLERDLLPRPFGVGRAFFWGPASDTYLLETKTNARHWPNSIPWTPEAEAGASLITSPTKKKGRARGGTRLTKQIPGHQRKRIQEARGDTRR